MKLRWDNQHVRWGVTSFLVIAASMLFYYGVFHMKTLITGIQTFLGILTPIVYGVVIAFLLTPVLNFLEKKIIYPLLARKEVSVGKKGRKAIRWACVILCMFLFLALIYALIMMILPELIRSIMGLIYSFPAYVKVIQKRKMKVLWKARLAVTQLTGKKWRSTTKMEKTLSPIIKSWNVSGMRLISSAALKPVVPIRSVYI